MPHSLSIPEQYAADVQSGKIPACVYVKQAVERYYTDLKDGEKRGLYFNPDFPNHVIQFFSMLKHYKGEYAGRPFILEPWQQFIIWNLYGWRMGDPRGPRRFRKAYIEIPKKNGKTTFAAGNVLYLAFMDGEPGAEVYTAATKRDQARLCFDDVQAMVSANPVLKKHLKNFQTATIHAKSRSKVAPLANDSNTADGINVHGAIIDELHRHKTSDMVELLDKSISARIQPLIFEITTAGSDKQSICYNHRTYTENVLAKKFKDDHWFGIIFTLDKDDDFRDPEVWIKANPNLGNGKSESYLADQVNKAVNDASKENAVKRFDFNIWTSAEEKWEVAKHWPKNAQEFELDDMDGLPCWGGLDLAATRDFNSLSLVWYNEEQDLFYTKQFFWIPKDQLDQRVQKQIADFDVWLDRGWIKATPGNVVDVNTIKQDVIDLCMRFNVQLAYDRALAHHGLIQDLLETGIEPNEQGQSIMHMSEPTKEVERLVLSGRLVNDGNPVMNWMMDNVVIYTDANENIKITKKASIEKVDGPVSLVMATAERMAADAEMEYSPYNEKDL